MSKEYMTDQEIREIYNKMYPKKWGEMYFSEQQKAIEKDRKNKYKYILCKILGEHFEELEQKQREYLNRIIEHTKKYDKIIKDMVKEYEDKIAEKDKEIEYLKFDNTVLKTFIHENSSIMAIQTSEKDVLIDEILSDNMIHFGERLKLVNKTKHRVCEEIANQLDEYIDTHRWKWETPDGKPKIVYIPNFVIRDILRKIEKGVRL